MSTTEAEYMALSETTKDAVIPWLKSAGKAYYDFGSGNLNHLIPRIKFYIADKFHIENLNEIDITLATSHFHDVVISKEGHAQGQDIPLDVCYENRRLTIDKAEAFKACMIGMQNDQKRNKMNASSNFDIIRSILCTIRSKKTTKIHSPGVGGRIGGYPVLFYCSNGKAEHRVDTTVFSREEMLEANRKSIYLDGIEAIKAGRLIYTDELINKVERTFRTQLPKSVHFDEIDEVSNFLIKNIIQTQL